MMSSIKYGVSLYSFSSDYYSGRMSLEDILRKVRELGYQGIEIVAAQMVPGYPYPTDEWLAHFRFLLDQYGLAGNCWSAYIDSGIQKERDLTREEIIHFTRNDLICAKKAGFSLVRTQHAITPDIMREMISLCRQLNMRLAVEMHAPHHPLVPEWRDGFLPLFRGEGRGVLGVVPDCSIFQRYPHKLFLDSAVEDGCRRDVVDLMAAMHRAGEPLENCLALPLLPCEAEMARDMYARFCEPAHISQIPELMDVAFYVHGKFYYLDDGQFDQSIPYEEVLPAIAATGFNGYIACEYEGHHYTDQLDTAEMLRRYMDMNRRILEKCN